MTVLDDGIGRYRYRMTVFSRYHVRNSERTKRTSFGRTKLIPDPFGRTPEVQTAEQRKNAGSGSAAEFLMRWPLEVQNRRRTPEVRVREDVETERRWRRKTPRRREVLEGLVVVVIVVESREN